jgi:hypothetical protein
MNICDKCGYKVISNKVFEQHLKTHVVDEIPVAPVVSETLEVEDPVIPEPAEEVKPIETPIEQPKADPIQPMSDEITLRFSKSIEVYINGKAYLGKEITVKNMSIAAEIVRIAREAYGAGILI